MITMLCSNLKEKKSSNRLRKERASENIDVLFFQPVRKEGSWLFSTALLQLASFLYQHGFKVKVVHLGINQNYKKTVMETLYNYNPQYVCVGLRWYPNMYVALETIKIVKSINNKIITIIGGHTASYFDEEIIKNNPSLDFVIKGDAELPLLNILTHKELNNCTYRDGKKIIKKPLKYTQSKEDLNGLHLVDITKIVDNIYAINLMQLKMLREPLLPRAYVWCGKGCNYNCIYCGARRDSQSKLFNRKSSIFRSVEDVLKDINEFSKVGINTLDFDFDPFINDKSFFLRLFKRIQKKRFNCVFNCWTLPQENLLESLHDCFKEAIVVLSPETFDESIREYYSENDLGKPYYSNEEMNVTIELLKDYDNLSVELYLLEGLPLQNNMSLDKGLDYTKLLIKNYPSVFKKLPDLLNKNTNSLSVYRPIYVYPLQIDPATFVDKKSNQLAEKCGMNVCRKTYKDFFNYSKKEYYDQPRNIFGFNASFNRKIRHNVNQYYDLLDRLFRDNVTYYESSFEY